MCLHKSEDPSINWSTFSLHCGWWWCHLTCTAGVRHPMFQSFFCWLENVPCAESNEYPKEVTTRSSLKIPAIFLKWVLAIQFHSKRKHFSTKKKDSPSATKADAFSANMPTWAIVLVNYHTLSYCNSKCCKGLTIILFNLLMLEKTQVLQG